MLIPSEGELYRVEMEFAYMEGEMLQRGDLHLVTRSRGQIVNTMRGGRHYMWYIDDFLSCAERVEAGE